MRIRIHSEAVDGCSWIRECEVPEPAELDEDEFWGDVVFPLTGIGGDHNHGNSLEEVVVIDANNPDFIGQWEEWEG